MSFEISTFGELKDGQRLVEVNGDDAPFSLHFTVGPEHTKTLDAFRQRAKEATDFDLTEPEDDFAAMLYRAFEDGELERKLTSEYIEQLQQIK